MVLRNAHIGGSAVPPELPRSAAVVVVGAGVHGLSTAWHLARAGTEVVVLDKTAVAAGASGIACGVVRNNYFQPAMSDLMAACVEVWESQAERLHYHGSGYLALGYASQEADLAAVHERHDRLGYASTLITGAAAVRQHMRELYPDWRAGDLEVCLHEHRGGYAFNRESMLGLADLAREAGASIHEGVEATGFVRDSAGAVTAVRTSAGEIATEQVVIAVGPWIPKLWEMLGLPGRLDVHLPGGGVRADQPMWTYWYLQEGEIDFPPSEFVTADGSSSAVLHVDSEQPLLDAGGRLITDEPWGVYFKPDRHSVQGGATPLTVGPEFEVDPYPTGTVEPGFPDMWCAALGHCLARFADARPRYRQLRSGGAGAFTADNFPVFDYLAPGVFVAADSNHGYKMIAVGREIARVLGGGHSPLLYPFRFERFATGDLHPVSHSPYPWS
jgi:glycine/D-amino acid oxidase-like deaminating enzyme